MLRHELLGMLVITVASLSVFACAELLKHATSLPRELTRKFAHVGCGMAVLAIPAVCDSHWTVLVLATSFAGLMVGTKVLGLLDSVHGVGRGIGGVLYYPFTAWLLYVLAFEVLDGSYVLYAVPVLVLATADAAGAIVGTAYGRTRYEVLHAHQRSVEGSLAVFATALVVIHVPLLLWGGLGRGETLLVSLTLALVATMLETVSVAGLDNLLVPLGTLLLLAHLDAMSAPELWLQLAVVASCAIGVQVVRWRKHAPTGGAVSLLLAGYASWTAGGIQWFMPMAASIGAFMLYERLSPVAEQHTRSRYGMGTTVTALAVPVLLVVGQAGVQHAGLQHAMYVAYVAALACDIAVIFYMLPQNPTFRLARLRRTVATRDLWQHAPTPGKLAFAAAGAALPVLGAVVAADLPGRATDGTGVVLRIPALAVGLWGLAGVGAFVATAAAVRRSHVMCRCCGSVALRGLHCCFDQQPQLPPPGQQASAARVQLGFRETYLLANTTVAAAALGVTWLMTS